MDDAQARQALANDGLILLNPAGPQTGPRTLLVSGVARSGTSLVARLLQMAGIPLGRTADGVVFEDTEIAQALEQPDRAAVRALIQQRDTAHAVWAFKRPNLFQRLHPDELTLFRAPSLILTFRDPVAIAQRNIISNRSFTLEALHAAAEDLRAATDFARRAQCPVLLLSYEKALVMPDRLVAALLSFAGLTLDDRRRAELASAVAVENPTYWRVARVEARGFIDAIAGGRLRGWCAIAGVSTPVRLELLIDGRPATEFRAELHRADLERAGIGDGRHGFLLDLGPLALRDDAVLAVRIKDRDFTLHNSGQTVRALRLADRAPVAG